MEYDEMLEQTNETENAETLTAEETMEGMEQADTTEAEVAEETTARKTLRELLKEDDSLQEEFNALVQGRLNRKEREFQKELSKYKDTDNVLRTTLNLKDGDDTNAKLREFYEADGIKLPEPIKQGLSSHQIEVLAKDEANAFIEEGFESMEEEANRLASIGYQNLNESEKIIFNTIAAKLTAEKNKKEILSLGASEELLKDAEFIKFREQFNSTTPMKDIYSLYKNTKKKNTVIENPGSMKNNEASRYKEFYTYDEISKLSEEDLDDPKIWEAVRNSMTKH